MKSITKNSLVIFSIIICTFFMILLTRSVCLTHNISLHPDEYVFYNASISLKDYLSGNSDTFSEVKMYPEGSYIFQAIIYLLFNLNNRIGIRISAMIYYAMGSSIGIVIIYRYFTKNIKSIIIYSLIVIFSLFNIEQSRYGTAEPISHFLLMLILLFCCESLVSKYYFVLLSYYISGILTAVKYPLIFFLFLPLISTLINNNKKIVKFLYVLIGIILFILGFSMFSPKAMQDSTYISNVINIETSAYVKNGNTDDLGGLFNHIFETIIFWIFYEGFPFSPLFSCISILHPEKYYLTNNKRLTLFITKIVPLCILSFITYNMFTTTLFFRTIYPFFSIEALYASVAIGELLNKNRTLKSLITLLIVILTARGIILISAMTNDDCEIKYKILINSINIIDSENTNEKCLYGKCNGILFVPFCSVNSNTDFININDINENEMVIDQNELVFTDSLEFGRCQKYIFKTNDDDETQYNKWQQFKEFNASYYVGKIYPTYYYYLFGYYLRCSTGSYYEFPSTMLYYRN